MKREDFEIYEVVGNNGVTYYCFNVEYYGFYRSSSKEEILKIQRRVRREVSARLLWVEEENRKYYEKLAQQLYGKK